MLQPPRLFADDAAIRRLGEGMVVRTLPRPEWTHEAHLATCAWLILERPDIVPERDLPDLIRRYNESVGGVNSDTEGYHETITQVSIRGVRAALARSDGRGLAERVNALLLAPEGSRDWPLRFYSRERLFSVGARLEWVEPDLGALPDTRSRPDAGGNGVARSWGPVLFRQKVRVPLSPCEGRRDWQLLSAAANGCSRARRG